MKQTECFIFVFCKPRDSQSVPRLPEQRRAVQASALSEELFDGYPTTGVVLLRWQLLSAVMMFLASTLNIRFRRSDYVGLCGDQQRFGRCFRLLVRNGCFGITMADITAIWHNIESVMIEEMNQTPPQWPMILTPDMQKPP